MKQIISHSGSATRACLLAAISLAAGWLQPAAAQESAPPAKVEVVPPLGHTGDGVTSAEISANGAVVASSGEDFSIRLWDVKSGRFLRTLFVDTAAKRAPTVALSSDGNVLLASLFFGRTVFDTRTGKPIFDFPAKDTTEFLVAMATNGKTVASTSDKVIKLADTAKARPALNLQGHTGKVMAMAFSPDGKRLVSGGGDASVRLWNVETGSPIRTLDSRVGEVSSLIYSPTGTTIVARGPSDDVLLETESGRALAQMKATDSADIDFSPDGSTLIANVNGVIKLWNTRTGAASEICRDTMKDYRLIGFAADNAHVLFEKDSAVFSVGTAGCDIAATKIAHAAVGLSSDRRRLLASNNLALELYDLPGTLAQTFQARAEMVRASWLSADGTTQVWTGADGSVQTRDTQTRKVSGRCETKVGESGTVALAPDNRRLMLSNDDNAVFFCDLTTSKATAPLYSHKSAVRSFALAPSGRIMASADLDGTVMVWDLKANRLVKSLINKDRPVNTLNFSADEKKLFVGTDDNRVRIWDTASWRELQNLRMMTGPVVALDLAPGGKTVAAGTSLLEIKLWDIETGKLLKKLTTDYPGDRMSTTGAVVYAPGNNRTMASSYGNRIMLWDTEAGRAVRTFGGVSANITGLAFAADKKNLLSVDEAGILKYWDPNTGTLLASAITFPDGEWIVVTPEGFFDASSAKPARSLNVVRGLDVTSIDQVYDTFYQPSLVREKLAGDPTGKVKTAAARLDLDKVIASGASPKVTITTPANGNLATADHVTVEATVTDQGGGIGKVEWRINGVTVGADDRGFARLEAAASPAGATRSLKQNLSLEPGDNRIELVVYNARGLIASEAAHITVKWSGEKAGALPRLLVMAVGVNDYYDSRLRLSYAVPDAMALAEAFRKAGTGLYAGVDVTTVLDKDVTVAGLDKAFADLGSKAQPRDVFVFFLAGHGKTKNGKYYFLPRDFRYEDDGSIEKSGMDQDKFQAWFAKIPARKSILLYDTCESGSLTGNATRGSDIDERLGALNRLTRATGRTFLTATTDDAPALEGYRGHGVFTYAILDALERADVNRNGLIEVSELADYIDQKVPDLSFEAFKLRQIPQRSIVGNNFALTNRTGVLAANSPAVPADASAIPTKPTHIVVTASPMEVFEAIPANGTGGKTVQRLTMGTPVVVVKSANGWDLIASGGRALGYVAHSGLAPVQ